MPPSWGLPDATRSADGAFILKIADFCCTVFKSPRLLRIKFWGCKGNSIALKSRIQFVVSKLSSSVPMIDALGVDLFYCGMCIMGVSGL